MAATDKKRGPEKTIASEPRQEMSIIYRRTKKLSWLPVEDTGQTSLVADPARCFRNIYSQGFPEELAHQGIHRIIEH